MKEDCKGKLRIGGTNAADTKFAFAVLLHICDSAVVDGLQDPHASALAGEIRRVLGTLKRRLREQVHRGDLTWSQIAVLARLERDGPATITRLARTEGMRPQSMGAIVAALDAAGHVGAAPDPGDRRQTIWSVTATCRDWIRAGRAARQDWLTQAIHTQLAAVEQEQLAAALALIARLVETP